MYSSNIFYNSYSTKLQAYIFIHQLYLLELRVKLAGHTKMQLFIRFLFGRSLLVTGPLPSQSEFHHLRLLVTALIKDLLHVAALGANNFACHLEVMIILDLYFVSTGKLWNLLVGVRFLVVVVLSLYLN